MNTNWGDARLPTRFWDKVVPEPNSGCWIWVGATNNKGYGVIGVGSRRILLAHRFSYSGVFGPVLPGLVLDHLCRNPICCNPRHVEAVTQRENCRRGAWGLRTHCPKNHVYEGDNLYTKPNGQRVCVTCRKAFLRVHYYKRKAQNDRAD